MWYLVFILKLNITITGTKSIIIIYRLKYWLKNSLQSIFSPEAHEAVKAQFLRLSRISRVSNSPNRNLQKKFRLVCYSESKLSRCVFRPDTTASTDATSSLKSASAKDLSNLVAILIDMLRSELLPECHRCFEFLKEYLFISIFRMKISEVTWFSTSSKEI